MRSLIFIDSNSAAGDQDYVDFLEEEMPRRLGLLREEIAGPWTATFAHEEYGDESMDEFAATLRRDGDGYDAVIIVPGAKHIDDDARITAGTPGHPYFKKLAGLVQNAGERPVVAFVDTPGPRTEFNLLSIGFAAVVDQTNEPALLPLKIARAANNNAGGGNELTMGPLTLDMKTGTVTVGEERVFLTPQERAVFTYLARNRGKVRSKEQILKSTYGLEEDEPEIKIIDVFMTKIRGKFNDRAPGLGFDLLRTSWGDGYYMLPDMPQGRVHRGLLRLDPLAEGGCAIADTQLTMTAAGFELFEYLHDRRASGVTAKDNFIMANRDTLDMLTSTLGNLLVAHGPAIRLDPEEDRYYLNPEYFDHEVFSASDFHTLMRQEIKAVGPYQFIRAHNANTYTLSGTEIGFQLPEIRLLENLVHVQGQAVRAHTLYRQVRGESHSTRGEKSPDEDVIDLARSVFRKLEQAAADLDVETNVHIYHDTYVSYGPAEEIPDPEKIRNETRDRIQAALEQRMSRAAGQTVVLNRYDIGHFALLVHPTLGVGLIEGQGIELKAPQVAILRAVHGARDAEGPAVIGQLALFETAYPARPYNKQKISTEIYHLRNTLSAINPEWKNALLSVQGGYVSLMPGEKVPEPKAAPEPVIDWQTIPLDRFTLEVAPEAGNGRIKGKGQALNANEIRILTALHAHRLQHDTAAMMSPADLYRVVYNDVNFSHARLTSAVNGLRTTLGFHDEEWAASLITRRGQGFAWLFEGDTLQDEIAPAVEANIDWQPVPFDRFTLEINPATGDGRIAEKGQPLSAQDVKILTTLHNDRNARDAAGVMPTADLYRTVFGESNYVPVQLTAAVNKLRNLLAFHDTEWGAALVTRRGQGFAWLKAGDTLTDDVAETPVDWQTVKLDRFTMQVNPDSGEGRIPDKGQALSEVDVKILTTLHADRAGREAATLMPIAELYRAVYGQANYAPVRLSTAVNNLRHALAYHDESWGEALVTRRAQGYAWLFNGDAQPEDLPTARPAQALRRAAAPREVIPPEEITLTGGLVLLRDKESGRAQVQGTEFVLQPREVEFFTLLSDRHPDSLFTDELQRRLQIANVKGFFDNFEKRWSIHCPLVKSPVGRRTSSTYVWALEPRGAAADADAAADTADFAFGKLESGMAQCDRLKMLFTLREMELLTLLEKNRGSTLALMDVAKGSKFKWNESIILQTLTAAQAKIARADPDLAQRLRYSAKKKSMELGMRQSRLPLPASRPNVA